MSTNLPLDGRGRFVYHPAVADTHPIPVRLSTELIAKLDAAASRLQNTRAGIVKMCLTSFLDSFEKRGRAILPLDWEEVLLELDGRTRLGKSKRRRRSEVSP